MIEYELGLSPAAMRDLKSLPIRVKKDGVFDYIGDDR